MNTAREFYLIKSISRLRCKEKRVRERKTFQFTRRTLLQLLQVKLSALPSHCYLNLLVMSPFTILMLELKETLGFQEN